MCYLSACFIRAYSISHGCIQGLLSSQGDFATSKHPWGCPLQQAGCFQACYARYLGQAQTPVQVQNGDKIAYACLGLIVTRECGNMPMSAWTVCLPFSFACTCTRL